MQNKIIIRGFLSALGVVLYIALVASLMFHGQALFGDGKSILIPIAMLLLFVVSACVTGLLVLGKPAELYLDGSKKEALRTLFTTIGWLAVFMLIFFAILFVRHTS